MDVPGIVRERLADERRMTSVNIGGDDRVYVTPPQTLVYYSAGLFSRESIDEFPHDARRFDVSADRREASFAFEYEDGVRGFSIPRERVDTVLPPVLAGVLRTTGLIGQEESIAESYRFGDRTLVVTDRQVLTSVGEAVWDREHERFAYDDVTDLRFEGETLELDVDGQPHRMTLSGDGGRDAYRTVEESLLTYHDADTVEALTTRTGQHRQQSTTDDTGASPGTTTTNAGGWGAPGRETDSTTGSVPDIAEAEAEPEVQTGSSVDSSTSNPATTTDQSPESEAGPETRVESDETAGASAETGGRIDEENLAAEFDALRETVERQTELLERQQATLERLVDELSYDQ